MQLSTEIIISEPIKKVFDYWADLEKANEWAAPVIERKKLTEGPIGVGTKFRAIDQFPGRQIEFIVEITDYKPNRFIAATWSKPMQGGWEVCFQEIEGGTNLTILANMKPSGILKVLSPILGIWAKRAMQKDLQSFKQRLETM